MTCEANILLGRFFLALKNVRAVTKSLETRFLVQENAERVKHMLIYTSVNVWQQTICMIVVMAAFLQNYLRFEAFLQAYLQISILLSKDVYK